MAHATEATEAATALHQARGAHSRHLHGSDQEVAWAAAVASEVIVALEAAWDQILVGVEIG